MSLGQLLQSKRRPTVSISGGITIAPGDVHPVKRCCSEEPTTIISLYSHIQTRYNLDGPALVLTSFNRLNDDTRIRSLLLMF